MGSIIEDKSYVERIITIISSEFTSLKPAIITAITTGILTYMFALTNKIFNWDDSQFLFGKGYTLTSGRWGLDIIQYILPNYSMPWLWGCLSLLVITISICIIIKLFNIKNIILQCLVAASIIAFPSEIGTMFYMFTSSSYAIAFLLTVIGVYLQYKTHEIKLQILGIILTVLSLSIYQAYIAISASFFVVLLIQDLLDENNDSIKLVKKGIGCVIFLLLSLIMYYGITLVLLYLSHSTFNAWAVRATSNSGSFIIRITRSWKLFAAMVLLKTYGLETTNLSRCAHIVIFSISCFCSLIMVIKSKDAVRFILYLFLLCICFPLSVNLIILIIGEEGIHALTLYSFISIYIFAAIIIDNTILHFNKTIALDIITICIAFIVISNIYIANKEYLKQYLVCENTYSFYQSIKTQILMTPDFSNDCKLAVIGNVSVDSSYLDNFGTDSIYGLNGFKGAAISDEVIHTWLGFDIDYVSDEVLEEIIMMDEVKSMPVYPNYGYIQKIDNYIIVKLGSYN